MQDVVGLSCCHQGLAQWRRSRPIKPPSGPSRGVPASERCGHSNPGKTSSPPPAPLLPVYLGRDLCIWDSCCDLYRSRGASAKQEPLSFPVSQPTGPYFIVTLPGCRLDRRKRPVVSAGLDHTEESGLSISWCLGSADSSPRGSAGFDSQLQDLLFSRTAQPDFQHGVE
jgi:hypothetical protein